MPDKSEHIRRIACSDVMTLIVAGIDSGKGMLEGHMYLAAGKSFIVDDLWRQVDRRRPPRPTRRIVCAFPDRHYAVAKRQVSTAELGRHGLTNQSPTDA